MVGETCAGKGKGEAVTQRLGLSILVLTLFAVLPLGCSQAPDADANDIPLVGSQPRDVVITTCYPVQWMTQKIVGSAVTVECVIPEGQAPSTWTPGADSIKSLQSARLIVTNGAGLEAWTDKTSLPTSRLVDTTFGLPDPLLQYENVVVHQHGPGGDQSPEGTDPHTWLDPTTAIHQAGRILIAAKRVWPQHKDKLESGHRDLVKQLSQLDERFRTLSDKLAEANLLFAQQSYNYVARRYKWNTKNLDLDRVAELNSESVQSILSTLDSGKTSILLFDESVSEASVNELTRAGARSVLFSTCATEPKDGDYLDTMNANLDRLNEALD